MIEAGAAAVCILTSPTGMTFRTMSYISYIADKGHPSCGTAAFMRGDEVSPTEYRRGNCKENKTHSMPLPLSSE